MALTRINHTNINNFTIKPITLDGLDFGNANPGDVVILSSDLTQFEFIPQSGGGGATDLNDLTDVTITSPVNLDVLVETNGQFVNRRLNFADLDDKSHLHVTNDISDWPFSSPPVLNDMSNVNATPISGDVLKWSGTGWISSASGEINSGVNVGSGQGTIFSGKSGLNLQFKSIRAGTNVIISQNANEITINAAATGGGESNTASSLGSGQSVYSQKSGVDLQFKSLVAGTDISLSGTGTEVTISSTASGESNTGSNLGSTASREGVFAQKSGTTLQFKSLVGTAPITLSTVGDEIIINSDAVDNTATNLGTGRGVFAQKNAEVLEFKSLIAGTNIGISATTTDITINSSASNKGAGEKVYDDTITTDLNFKTLVAGTNVTISSDTDEITINSSGGGSSVFESIRVNYNAFGTITSLAENTAGITSTTIDASQWISFEFSHNKPPASIIYYAYKDLGSSGWGYKMTMPSTSSMINEVLTGGVAGAPAELLTNMSPGKIRLQARTQETFADNDEHAYIFFLF